ncbi:MAG: filamentous hemagglutinin N-terminal domain-containing protein, partial [Prochlorotrichaceae cyanobacterium]
MLHVKRQIIVGCVFFSIISSEKRMAYGQVIPAADDIGTMLEVVENDFRIQGGKQAGTNLFHSFQDFNLASDQTATFLSPPTIANILGRVVGGNASSIDGLIRMSGGSSNLYLMNPSGMVFGPNAHLELPGAFTATTATGIGFEGGSFHALGDNDYATLVGSPNSFHFGITQPGTIVNLGALGVEEGQTLNLMGGVVFNVGTLSAPGGSITVTA